MQHSNEPEAESPGGTKATEEALRRELEDLKRQLHAQNGASHGTAHGALVHKRWQPSGLTIAAIFVGLTILIVGGFFAGYVPLQKRRALIGQEAWQQEQALPSVDVLAVARSNERNSIELPGNIEAVTEAPILARATGYIKRRMADIGDRVQSGQMLAEIEAPELDEQLLQAKANLQQAQAALEQALASSEQGKSNMELARVTAERWSSLSARGVVSRQENDQYQAQYKSQLANVQALEKAIAAQRGNIAAAEANVARLNELQGFRAVNAPFEGVVTTRNVDVGTLVNAGSTLLFRVAQTGTVRTYVNVPQSNAGSIRIGQPAQLTVASLAGRHFTGTVTRTANALDPASRTLLVEVQVANADGALLPGMYAQVDVGASRPDGTLVVPGNALISKPDGIEVALVRSDHTVHLQKIGMGRDYGGRVEVVSGLREGDLIIPNPGDIGREGLKVNPVPAGHP